MSEPIPLLLKCPECSKRHIDRASRMKSRPRFNESSKASSTSISYSSKLIVVARPQGQLQTCMA